MCAAGFLHGAMTMPMLVLVLRGLLQTSFTISIVVLSAETLAESLGQAGHVVESGLSLCLEG